MEPPPPVDSREDPLFAARIAFGVTLAFALAEMLRTPMVMLPPVLIATLMASARGAFNAKRVIGAGLGIPVMAWVSSALVSITRGEMLVFFVVMAAVTFFVLLFVMRTANRMGLLLLIFPHLLGLVGTKSQPAMEAMRDSIVATGFMSLAIIPLAYVLLAPKTRAIWEEAFEAPGFEKPWEEALIRTAVLIPLMIGFYLWVDVSDMIYFVMAVIVLVQPHVHQQRREAGERVLATLLGGVVAIASILLVSVQPHVPVLVLVIALACLMFGDRMIRGRFSSNAYQLALVTFVTLIAGAATTTSPLTSALDRTMLTIGGVLFALGAMWTLRRVLSWARARAGKGDGPGGKQATARA